MQPPVLAVLPDLDGKNDRQAKQTTPQNRRERGHVLNANGLRARLGRADASERSGITGENL